jgi:hypothetical protein
MRLPNDFDLLKAVPVKLLMLIFKVYYKVLAVTSITPYAKY